MGNKDITDFNEAQLRKRAASKEELNICLTNNYAFQKIFKNEEIVKGFLIALLHLKETDIEELEVTDPFVEGEVKEEKEFYNIKDRNHSADCPHIYHKSSDGGQEPYYCGLRDCQISSDEYYHLCAYEWTAEKKCPYKGRR